MKTILVCLGLLFRFGAHAQELDINLDATLERIEIENNAKCEFETAGAAICSSFSWQKHFYTCESPGGDFRMSLRVKKKATGPKLSHHRGKPYIPPSPCENQTFGDPVVTKIIFYKN